MPLLLLATLFCSTPLSAAEPAAPRTLRIMTYNIHHGEGTDGKLDLPRIARLVADQKADIVALQEVDRGVERSGRIDQAEELAALLDMHYAFGKNIDHQGGDYGNATLSRFPIRRSANHHYKTVLNGEQRGLLETTLDIDGRTLVLLNTHLDYHRKDTERLACVAELKELAARHGEAPMVICGDFNATPESRTNAQLRALFQDSWRQAGQGPGYTIPSVRPRSRIDYVWTKGAIRPVRAEVVESVASDHCALVVDVSW